MPEENEPSNQAIGIPATGDCESSTQQSRIPNVPYHLDRRPGDYPRRRTPKYGWRDDNGRPIHEINEDGTPICGRICSITGLPCSQTGTFLTENGRCAGVGHGGRAPGAPVKHGRYSIFLPTRLAASYEEIVSDDVIGNVHDSISVGLAMLQEKFTEMSEDSSAALWAQAGREVERLQRAVHLSPSQPLITVAETVDRLAALHSAGSGIPKKEKEIFDIMTKMANLTKVEIYRLEKMNHFMTARQAMANSAKIISILRKYVDPATCGKVATEIGAATYASYTESWAEQDEKERRSAKSSLRNEC